MKILNYGSANIDYVYQVDHLVAPGETISSNALITTSGGKGLNQSVALAKAGGLVYHAGVIHPTEGSFLKELMEKSGVHTEYLNFSQTVSNGHAIIQVDSSGQNSIILYPGTNFTNTKEQIDQTLTHFSNEDFLVLQNEINHLDYILEQARRKGMTIFLNPSPITPSLTSLPLQSVDYFILNELEASALTNHPLSSDKNLLLEGLHQRFPKAKIILTLGEKGSVYWDSQNCYSQPIYSVQTVDTTAAGDTFTGYFIASLSHGNSPKESLNLAAKASALTVSKSGAADSIPFLDTVLTTPFKLA